MAHSPQRLAPPAPGVKMSFPIEAVALLVVLIAIVIFAVLAFDAPPPRR